MMGTESCCPSNVPVIMVVPDATAVTIPDAETVATPGALDPHVGVISALVPSL